MLLITSLLVIGAVLLLLAAGYLIGIRRGSNERENLRDVSRSFAKEIVRLRNQAGPQVNGDNSLRATLEDILSPLVHRERLSYEMSRLEGSAGQQRDLTALLDQMAEKGNFSSVLLNDEQGWRIAANSTARNPERLGATASLLLLLVDRIARDASPAPLSVMLHDTENATTLCRVFQVDGHRMTLTVVANGCDLTPAAVDPALAKLNAMLLGKNS
jgi:hypothetical protein